MKKFLTITLLTLVMMAFVACGGNSSGKKDKDPTDPTNPTEEPTDNPTDNPSEPTESTEEDDGCTGFSADWSQLTMYQSNFFYLGEDPVVYLELYQNANYTVEAGTYDLASEPNSNYETCTECVRILKDYVEAASEDESGHYEHIYFQKSGTLTIDGVDDNGNIKGTIEAKLIEVTIDSETYASTPVEGGACLKIETATFDSGWEEPCVPQCEGKQCGSDGCGGVCGTCKGQACSADFQCVPFDCKDIEFEDEAFEMTGSAAYSATPITTLGSPELEDSLQLRFYNDGIEKGTIDLGSEINSNYKDCTECFLLLEDVDEDGYPSKIFFQESGELVFDDVKEDTYESKGHASLRLIEVEISSDYSSIPVAGGKCYNVANITWDTICVPQCDGKQCGSDGCGGVCGTCEGQACSADFQCVPFNCDKIDVSEFELIEEEDWFGDISYYYDAYATGKGIGSESIPDLLEIGFIADELKKGTVTLTGDTENISDAYVILYEDYDTENYEIGKYYFQESGTLNFTEVKAGTFESKGTGSFRLIEVDDNFFAAAGGKCYEFENISWNTIK